MTESSTLTEPARLDPLCITCGKNETPIRKVSRGYRKRIKLVAVENVPVVTCPHYGESYRTVDTRHELERIKLQQKRPAHECRVAIARFGSPASSYDPCGYHN